MEASALDFDQRPTGKSSISSHDIGNSVCETASTSARDAAGCFLTSSTKAHKRTDSVQIGDVLRQLVDLRIADAADVCLHRPAVVGAPTIADVLKLFDDVLVLLSGSHRNLDYRLDVVVRDLKTQMIKWRYSPRQDAAVVAQCAVTRSAVGSPTPMTKSSRSRRTACSLRWMPKAPSHCDRCHGADQTGLVGPSLIEALKILTPEQFYETVTDGACPRSMPSFKGSARVMSNLDNLYDYLKGRSDGAIKQPKVEAMQ